VAGHTMIGWPCFKPYWWICRPAGGTSEKADLLSARRETCCRHAQAKSSLGLSPKFESRLELLSLNSGWATVLGVTFRTRLRF